MYIEKKLVTLLKKLEIIEHEVYEVNNKLRYVKKDCSENFFHAIENRQLYIIFLKTWKIMK